jgi:hypothetical protein
MDTEDILDLVSPEQFFRFDGFGQKYVSYVRNLRALDPVDNVIDLMAPKPYVRPKDTFHSLEDRSVDCTITVNLSATQGSWLSRVLDALPLEFPNDPSKHTLGFAIRPMLIELMKQDTGKHGQLRGESGMGTMNTKQMNNFRMMNPNG